MSETVEGTKVWIPDVPKSRIVELARIIRPVVQVDGRGKCHIEPVDLFGVAFTWDPVLVDEAIGLRPLCQITTYHKSGYQGFFKPSIAEVLAQIPEEHLGTVVAFEIVKSPKDAADLYRESEALNAGYHVATTQLYAQT